MQILAFFLFAFSWAVALGNEQTPTCKLSDQEMGRLAEFQNIKTYLKANVYPDWPEDYPNLFFYDDECQYVLNYTGRIEGFSLSNQKFRLPGFKSDVILYRRNSVKAPFGALDYVIPAQGFTWGTPGSEKWFVMALYPVWKREWKDNLSMWYGMLSHEMFHPYQFTLPGIREKLDRLDESTFTKYYKSQGEFGKDVDAEIAHLRRAVTTQSDSERSAEVRKFLELRDKRRKKYLAQAPFIADEPAMETAEGVAEYMNFRLMTDSKRFKTNDKLKSIDPDFDEYALFRSFSEADAMKKMEATNSYTQKIGVFTVILLNKVDPSWASRIHTEYGENLLRSYVSRH